MPVPKNIKRFKPFLQTKTLLATSCNTPSFSKFGVKALSSKKIGEASITSTSKSIKKTFKTLKTGLVNREVLITGIKTKKGLGMRQGGGKGSRDSYYQRIKKGQVIFEIDKVDMKVAKDALRKASSKMSIPLRIVKKRYSF